MRSEELMHEFAQTFTLTNEHSEKKTHQNQPELTRLMHYRDGRSVQGQGSRLTLTLANIFSKHSFRKLSDL